VGRITSAEFIAGLDPALRSRIQWYFDGASVSMSIQAGA
jgi:hypothetical protein